MAGNAFHYLLDTREIAMKRFTSFLCFSLFAVVSIYGGSDQTELKEFRHFWKEFREAVMVNNKPTITALTQFPFLTRGEMDSDPILKHDRAWFQRNYSSLLDVDPGTQPSPETMRALIVRKNKIEGNDIQTKDFVRIGVFEFKKIDGKWRWVFAYRPE